MPLGEEGHRDNSQKGSDIKSSFLQQASHLEKIDKCCIDVLGGQSNGLAPIMSHKCDPYIYLLLHHIPLAHIRSDHVRSYHIKLDSAILYHIMSYHITPYFIILYRITFSFIISDGIVFFIVFYSMRWYIKRYFIISYHLVSQPSNFYHTLLHNIW